jgi:hypothetical protein
MTQSEQVQHPTKEGQSEINFSTTVDKINEHI